MCIDAASSATSSTTTTPPPRETNELERTKSQLAASVKLESVSSHVADIIEPVQELHRRVSELAERSASPDLAVEALKEDLGAIDEARKRARNFGEDLVEDMLALDGLGELLPVDRATRKRAIASIESLLDDVDSMKAKLNTLQKSLEARLEAAEIGAPSGEAPSLVGASTAAPTSTSASVAASSERRLDEFNANDASLFSKQVPQPPVRELWSRLRLPVRFRSQEESRCYVIRVSVPDLDTDGVKLSLSEDRASLTVAGLRVPSDDQAKYLHAQLTSRLRQLTSGASGSQKLTERRIKEVAESAYLEMGQNRYGSFTETFRLPGDADVVGIEASYQDGVLRVVVPKLVARGCGFRGRFVSPRGAATYHPGLRGARCGGGVAAAPFGGFGGSYW